VRRVDGGQKSGSGTIVRHAVALAALLGEPLHLFNIRAKRDKPGLRPQHLKAVEAVAELTGGELEGAKVGSSELWFRPGERGKGGSFVWDIGTAGSTTMLALTVLPVAAFAPGPVKFRVRGGLFQDFAPSAFHTQHVLLPALRAMGLQAHLEVCRPGYVPQGGGEIELEVRPVQGALQPVVRRLSFEPARFWGIALSSHLRSRRVSERLAQSCQEVLAARGLRAEFQIVHDNRAVQAGAALALFAEDRNGIRLGADQAGAPGRSSESMGKAVAHMLLEDLATGATVDRHLADQLVLYAALAQGTSEFHIPRWTDHVEANLWLVQEILGAQWELEGNLLRVRGVGHVRQGSG